MQKYMRN